MLHDVAICELVSKWSIGSNSQLSFWDDKWLDMGTIKECIEGPLHNGEVDIRVCDIHSNGMWKLHKLTFIFPPVLSQAIKATSIRTASSSVDHSSTHLSSPRREFDSNNAYLIACGANTNEECFRGN